MSANGYGRRADLGQIYGDLAKRLHCVGVERHTRAPARGGYVSDGLDGAHLVVRPHNRNQRHSLGRRRQQLIDEIHIDSAGCIDRNPPHVRALVLAEPFDGVEDGVVLDRRCGHDRIGDTQSRPTGPQEPLDGEVVRFGSTRGEDDRRGSRAQIVGDGFPSLFHDPARGTTGRMQG